MKSILALLTKKEGREFLDKDNSEQRFSSAEGDDLGKKTYLQKGKLFAIIPSIVSRERTYSIAGGLYLTILISPNDKIKIHPILSKHYKPLLNKLNQGLQ